MAIPFLSDISGKNATFAGDVNTLGDVHIDEGSSSSHQTTNKLRFGHTSWNNNIGIESYWMRLGCNQNEGFKFEDSNSNMLLLLQGGNNSSANGALSATFAGTVTTDKIFVAKGQNLAHVASSIITSQESTTKSQIRFYGADTSTAGILEFVGSTSNGSSSGARLTLNADGSSTFAGNVGINETSIDANLHISDGTTPNIKFEKPGTKKWAMGISGTDFVIDDVNDNLSTHVLKLAADDSATFAGDVTVTGGDITLGTDSIASNINAVGDVLAFKVDSNENTGGTPNIQFKVGSATELTINGSSATFAGTVGMANGYATGKFAVKSSAVHGSFDFYNDGTTYLNGATTVDADLRVTGTNEDSFIIGPQAAGSGTILMSLNAAENAYEPLRLDVETFKVTASGGTSPCIIETSGLNTTFGGNVSIQADDADFLVRSNDYTISRIISRGSSGTNLDKGLFSLMSSDGTNNNIEKVRIDSAGGSWFNGGSTTFGGDVSLNNNNKITFDKTNSAGGGDFNFIEMGYNGSWSQNQGGLAAISVDDGTGVVGKYGITYGTGGGRFVVTDLYDGGYGASGDVLEIRGDGKATFAGSVSSGQVTATVSSGSNFEARKGDGTGAVGFGGTSHQTGLIEGVDGGGLKLYTAGNDVNWGGAWALNTTWSGTAMTVVGAVTATSFSGDGSNLTNLPAQSAPSNMVTTDTAQTISGNKTFTGTGNTFNGHLYYNAYDSQGQHYPHFRDGTANNGADINWRHYYGSSYKTHQWTSDSSGNMAQIFQGRIEAVGELKGTSLDINGAGDISGELTINNAANNNNLGIHIKNDNNLYSGALTFWTEYSGTDTHTARVQAGTDGTDAALYLQVANTSKTLTSVLILDHDLQATFAGNVTLPANSTLNFSTDIDLIHSTNNLKFVQGGSDRFSISGDVGVLGATDFYIPAGRKLLLDGLGGHTYIEEESDSNLKFYVAGSERLNITNTNAIFAGGTKIQGDLTIEKSTPTLTFNNLAGGGLDPILEASGTNFNIKTTSVTPLSINLSTQAATFGGSINVDGNGSVMGDESTSSGTSVLTLSTYEPFLVFKKGRDSANGYDYFKIKCENPDMAVDFTTAYNGGSDNRTARITSNGRWVIGGHEEVNASQLSVQGNFGIKQPDDSGFDGGLTIERSANTQKVHIGMDGGAVNFNSPDGLSFKFRNNGTEKFTVGGSGNAIIAGSVKVGNALIDSASVTSATTTTTVASVAVATYGAAFFDYVAFKGANIRAGTIAACSDGTNVSFAETSTTDLGDTSDVTFAVDISSGDMRLRATTTSSTWTIKALIRAI